MMSRRSVVGVSTMWWQVMVVIGALLPLVWIAFELSTQVISNPTEHLQRATGNWAFRLLLLTLCITPLRVHFGWLGLLRIRRTMGLMCFAYAMIHLITYLWLDMQFDGPDIFFDLSKRPFILIGLTALALMIPMALTSNNKMVRTLGVVVWKRIHRAIYLIAVLVAVHYFMATKVDLTLPLVYAGLVFLLLAWRAWAHYTGRIR
jgi:methionine sulfoxide reductase heme-binding subunit